MRGLSSNDINLAPPGLDVRARNAAVANVAKLFDIANGAEQSTKALTVLLSPSGLPAGETLDMLQSVATLGTLSPSDNGAATENRVRAAASKFNQFVRDASRFPLPAEPAS